MTGAPGSFERRGGYLGVGDGVHAFAGGIAFVLGTPAIWPYAAVPVCMMGLLTCGVGALGIWGAGEASNYLLGETTGWGGRLGSWVLTILMSLSALIVAGFLGLCLAQPLSGFALETIAREQERRLTGRTGERPSFVAALFTSLQIVAVTVSVGGGLLATLFLVNLVFPPAALVTVPLKVLVCGWLLAWDFLDYPLAQRGLNLNQRLQWVRRNLDAFTVFGVGWTLLAVVPGVVLLLLPMGVAGAAQLVVADERLRAGWSEPR